MDCTDTTSITASHWQQLQKGQVRFTGILFYHSNYAFTQQVAMRLILPALDAPRSPFRLTGATYYRYSLAHGFGFRCTPFDSMFDCSDNRKDHPGENSTK